MGRRPSTTTHIFLQRFTPRSKRSAWSAINTARVDRLARANKMTPSGHSQVDAAKADGRWDAAYAGQASAVVPDDLQAALDASPAASAVFADLDGGNRYAILFRIGQAKRADTRARKIAEFVAELEQGRTPYPRKPGEPTGRPIRFCDYPPPQEGLDLGHQQRASRPAFARQLGAQRAQQATPSVVRTDV
jgi:hypothetical protein